VRFVKLSLIKICLPTYLSIYLRASRRESTSGGGA